MDFDKIIDRRGTNCVKWDMMEPLYGVSPEEGLAMWVADTDFAVPEVVSAKMREMEGELKSMRGAIANFQANQD